MGLHFQNFDSMDCSLTTEVIYSKSYFAILFLGIAVLIFSICVMVDFAIRPIYGFVANKVAEYTMLIKGNIKWKNQIIK